MYAKVNVYGTYDVLRGNRMIISGLSQQQAIDKLNKNRKIVTKVESTSFKSVLDSAMKNGGKL